MDKTKTLNDVADIIMECFDRYDLDAVECIYILDRLKYNYHNLIDEVMLDSEE